MCITTIYHNNDSKIDNSRYIYVNKASKEYDDSYPIFNEDNSIKADSKSNCNIIDKVNNINSSRI
jgi:hypothetical protein